MPWQMMQKHLKAACSLVDGLTNQYTKGVAQCDLMGGLSERHWCIFPHGKLVLSFDAYGLSPGARAAALGGLNFQLDLVLIKCHRTNISSLSPAWTFLFFPVARAAALATNS